MSRRPEPRHLAAALIALAAPLALSACLTPKAKAPASAAVLEARKGVGQKVVPCQATPLADVSPAMASFPFDDSVLDAEGQRAVRGVAAYLACHPQTPVVVSSSADKHGDDAHQKDLAGRRGQAVLAALRADGSQAVVRMLAPGAADPVSGPHIVISAAGRGW
jgi:outer membrane protein OmpA-like peptidoglycan-associated protein